jgi:hypothetical protein
MQSIDDRRRRSAVPDRHRVVIAGQLAIGDQVSNHVTDQVKPFREDVELL